MSFVDCPLCSQRVILNFINSHIDSGCQRSLSKRTKRPNSSVEKKNNILSFFGHKSKAEATQSNPEKNEMPNRKRKFPFASIGSDTADIIQCQLESQSQSQSLSPAPKRRKLNNSNTSSSSPICEPSEMNVTDAISQSTTYEKPNALECKSEECCHISEISEFVESQCFYFDTRIVGHKFIDGTKQLSHSKDHDLSKYGINNLMIRREKANAKDCNACIVAIRVTNQSYYNGIGYLIRHIAKDLAPLMDIKAISVEAFVTGDDCTDILSLSTVRIHCRIRCCDDSILKHWLCLRQSQMNASQSMIDTNDRYLYIFTVMIESVLNKYAKLFDPDSELPLLHRIIAYKNSEDSNEKNAVRLLSRIVTRKRQWLKLSGLQFNEVSDSEAAAKELCNIGIVIFADSLPSVQQSILECLSKEDLKQLVTKCGLKSKSGDSIATITAAFMTKCNTQKTIFGVKLCDCQSFLKKWRQCVEGFISFSDDCRRILDRCRLLFYLSRHKTMQTSVLADMGQTVYHNYRIDTSIESCVFTDKATFDAYVEALEQLSILEQNITDENISVALQSIEIAQNNLIDCQSTNDGSTVDSFANLYRADHIYCKMLHLGASLLCDEHNYEESLSIYQTLLQCEKLSYRRGKWFAKATLIADYHLKQHSIAYQLCQDGLSDNCVDLGDRNALIKRYKKMYKKLKLSKPEMEFVIPQPSDSLFVPNESVAAGVESIDISKDIPNITIEGRPINCKTGEKSRFFGFDDSVCSVEELVLQYYNMTDNGNWNGIHCEGGFIRALFSVLMWDIIFADTPLVFQTPFQSEPLDMNTPFFFINRKQIINDRIQHLQSYTAMQISDEIRRIWNAHYNKSVVGMYWNQWSLDSFIQMCQCLGGTNIAAICYKLALNHRYWGGGVPDLFLWRNVENSSGKGGDVTFESKLVEVKGPRDRLSDKQAAWIIYLKSVACDVLVCNVKEP